MPSFVGEDAGVVLKVCQQPPLGVFFGEAFEIGVVVELGGEENSDTGNNAASNLFDIDASLVEEDRYIRLVLLQVPNKLASGVVGILHCSFRENETTASRTTLPFYEGPLQISARCDSSITTIIRTATVTAARYKIVANPTSDWTNVWYKDEGGRDKCVTVMAAIYDNLHTLARLQTVPFSLTLCYAVTPPIVVNNQEILRVIGGNPNKLEIDKATGHAKIRFRIEDVSKNHQGQDFCVKISASRIAPGMTPPVTVRSKRNKRNRLSSTTTSSSEGPAAQRSSALNVPFGSSVAAFGGRALDIGDLARLRDAIRGVEQWAENVVSGLYPLQWQVVGYAQDDRGNPDYSRPFHSNMVNPNALISRVLATYNESTREQLNLLCQTFDATTNEPPRRSPVYSTAIPSAVMPPLRLPPPPPPGYPFSMRDIRNHGHAMPLYSASQRQLPAPMPNNSSADSKPPANDRSALLKSEAASRKQSSESGTPSEQSDQHQEDEEGDHDTMEDRVEYLLAKQFKSVRSGERLGFPAYSAEKELLGFYQEFGNFVPIPSDFGPTEKQQAVTILENAPVAAVHAKQDRSIGILLNHALVYEWSQGLSEESSRAK